MISNLNVYLSIAEEALAEAQRVDSAARTPRPDGEPGFVKALDPTRMSFKQSLIAIAFSGMYLEALLYIVGTQRLSKSAFAELRTYEDKLRGLGIADASVLANCTQFRKARNDLTHEKAVEVHELGATTLRTAQLEAAHAVAFVKSVAALLQNAPNPSLQRTPDGAAEFQR